MRMCLIQALAEFDVGPSRLSAEVYAPALGRGKVGLCIDGHTGTVIELKFPRDSAADAGAADTMIFGELLRDFCRVAVVDARERWVAQIIHARLARYLAAATNRYGVEWATKPGETMALTREALQRLPKVSLVAIGDTPWRLPVRATCTEPKWLHNQPTRKGGPSTRSRPFWFANQLQPLVLPQPSQT